MLATVKNVQIHKQINIQIHVQENNKYLNKQSNSYNKETLALCSRIVA